MSRSAGLCPLVVWLVACDPDREGPRGTSVGNPGKTQVSLARAAGLEVEQATLQDALVELIGCDLTRATLLTGTVDLLEDEPAVVPAGEWCALVLSFSELSMNGLVDGDGQPPFEVRLAPETTTTLWVGEPVVVDETAYVLEVGDPGWLAREQLGEGDIDISPESDLAPSLTYNLIVGTSLFEDDGDGILDEDERATGALASPSEIPPAALGDGEQDRSVALEGCSNCATGRPEPSLLWLPLLVWIRASWLTGNRRTAGPRRSADR